MSLRSPLGRVLGSGSAKDGTDHWWQQRVTAVALLLLGIWFLIALLQLPDFSYDRMFAWVRHPWHAILLFLLMLTLAWHSNLGLKVVIDDYVHQPFVRVAALIAVRFIHVLLATAAAFAILTSAFGAAA